MKKENLMGVGSIIKRGVNKSVIVHLPHDAMIYEEQIPKLKNGPLTSEFPGGDYFYIKMLYGKEEYAGKTPR